MFSPCIMWMKFLVSNQKSLKRFSASNLTSLTSDFISNGQCWTCARNLHLYHSFTNKMNQIRCRHVHGMIHLPRESMSRPYIQSHRCVSVGIADKELEVLLPFGMMALEEHEHTFAKIFQARQIRSEINLEVETNTCRFCSAKIVDGGAGA